MATEFTQRVLVDQNTNMVAFDQWVKWGIQLGGSASVDFPPQDVATGLSDAPQPLSNAVSALSSLEQSTIATMTAAAALTQPGSLTPEQFVPFTPDGVYIPPQSPPAILPSPLVGALPVADGGTTPTTTTKKKTGRKSNAEKAEIAAQKTAKALADAAQATANAVASTTAAASPSGGVAASPPITVAGGYPPAGYMVSPDAAIPPGYTPQQFSVPVPQPQQAPVPQVLQPQQPAMPPASQPVSTTEGTLTIDQFKSALAQYNAARAGSPMAIMRRMYFHDGQPHEIWYTAEAIPEHHRLKVLEDLQKFIETPVQTA